MTKACEFCRWATFHTPPQGPKPAPKEDKRSWWRKVLDSIAPAAVSLPQRDWPSMQYEMQEHLARKKVACHYNPVTINKDRFSWCRHFERAGNL